MNVNWEKALLGTALYRSSVEGAEHLLPSDFTGCHQLIWGEILGLARADQLDLRGVVEGMRDDGSLESVASFDTGARGDAYFPELLESRGDQLELYAEHILDASIKRQLQLSAALIRADADDERISGDEALDNAERRLMALRRDRLLEDGVTLGDVLAVYMPKLEGMITGNYEPAWTPNLQALRSLIDYAEEEDFIIGAGRPGDGKSSVMRYEAYHSGLNHMPVCIFNLENSHSDYARGFLALHTGIDSRKMKDPRRLADEELERIRDAARLLATLPIHIVTLGAPSALEVERIARKKISQDAVTWIGIDYIQLIANGVTGREEDVSISSREVRSIALRYNVPVFTNAQLNRNIEHRSDDSEPELSDLRDSGSLEQDATIVLFYRRRWRTPLNVQLRMFPENMDDAGNILPRPNVIPLDIYCKKHRNGVTGLADPVAWHLPTGNLRTLDRHQLPNNF